MKTIDPAELQKRIKNNKILNKLVYFDTIDSTNKFLAENDFASGTIAMAGEQKTGRGKHGAAWVSPAGGLWLSYVINRKIIKPYDYVALSSVALVEALKVFCINAEIKWPNDILVKGKKLAGILLENDYYNGRLITGLGLNVNNKIPGGLNAVSVKQLLRGRADINRIAAEIIGRIDASIAGLKGKRASLYRRWTGLQKNLEGSEINLVKRGKTGKVKVIKVSGGRIKVQDKKGGVFSVSGEVFFK